tara:strand:+ start:321 stop:1856 length:1536 start_codon:yes stop_codon:yes gene_type:complete
MAAPCYPPLHELTLTKERQPEPSETSAFPWADLLPDLQRLVLDNMVEQGGCDAWGTLCKLKLDNFNCRDDAFWERLHDQYTQAAVELKALLDEPTTPDKVKNAKRPILKRIEAFAFEPSPLFGRAGPDWTWEFDALSGTSIDEEIPLMLNGVTMGWRREFIFRCALKQCDWTWWHAPSRTLVLSAPLRALPEYDPTGGLLRSEEGARTFVFPRGVEVITEAFFENFRALETVLNMDAVVFIGKTAFAGCFALKTLKLPRTLRSIRPNAFRFCEQLELKALPPNLEFIGEYAFYACKKLDLRAVPASVTSIGTAAFNECHELRLAGGLPDELERIAERTFAECYSLALPALPPNIVAIGRHAFKSCFNLALTSLGEGPMTLGEAAFEGCRTLELTTLPALLSNNGSNDKVHLPNTLFQGCTSLRLTSLPANVTSIGYHAFWDCVNMPLTELPPELKKIEFLAFRGCRSMKVTALPKSLTSLADTAFDRCHPSVVALGHKRHEELEQQRRNGG